MKYLQKYCALLGCLGVVVFVFAFCQPASAQLPPSPASCTQDVAYAALYTGGEGAFDVYARLASRGDEGDVRVIAVGDDGQCQTVGSTRATGSGWHRIGSWQSPGKERLTQFALVTSVFQGFLEANRPMLMLVPRHTPVCQPTDECRVTIAGQSGVIRPRGRSSQGDTLRVVEVHDPANDKLEEVAYYVDNKPAYTKSQLEPFDIHYVGPGEHTLQRVLRYASGQQVVMTENLNRGYANGIIGYMFFSFVYQRRTVLQLVAGSIIAVVFWWFVLLCVHALYRRHLWRVTHIARARVRRAQPSPGALPEPLHLEKPDPPLIAFMKYLLPFGLILAAAALLVVVVDSYVLSITQISGVSMQNTLHDGDVVLAEKWDKTWATVSRKPYRVGRGDVVLVASGQGVEVPDHTETLIKRVIGLPGDRVVVSDGKITIYNDEHPDGFDPDYDSKWRGTMLADAGNVLLPGRIVDITVGPGELFICGDNRGQSTDSRTFGTVEADAVVAHAVLRLNDPAIL